MLPIAFRERMENLLGEESAAFFAALENEDAIRSFRVNGCKLTAEDLEELAPVIHRERMSFPNGAYYTEEKFPGSLPCHHAGMIYMQDPSAMATAGAVEVKKGMKVLDCCAAPGGKSTQLAALIGDEGLLVANEYESKRARILQSNVERMGCRNAVVLNLDTKYLAERYPGFFDLVVVDAPCSGEGMFRKNSLAIEEWNPENVLMCSERQKEILSNAVRCVAPGGCLLYSTCTFSLEENEYNVDWFLEHYSDFALVDVTDGLKKVTSDGISYPSARADMTKTRRFYPHKSRGEGQFIALFRHTGEQCTFAESKKEKRKEKPVQKTKPDPELAVAERFLQEHLSDASWCIKHKLIKQGSFVYLQPEVALPDFGVVMPGVCVGEVVKGRLVPHHQLFSAYGPLFARRLELAYDDPDVLLYLRGFEIPEGDRLAFEGKAEGWTAVLIGGVALGGCKISSGICKNHYPKGLRNKQ